MRSLVFLILITSSAFAQLPGEYGIAIWNGTDNLIETGAVTLNFQSGDFVVTSTAGGEVQITAGANLTELGQTIGDVGTEFADPTVMPYDVIGGTVATAILSLKPTSNATISTGSVQVCADTPAMTGTSTCLSLFPDGATLATNGTLASAITVNGSYTQTTDAGLVGLLPAAYVLTMTPTLKITDSSINGTNFGGLVGINMTATLTNSTDDNYGGGGLAAFNGGIAITKTSTGTASGSGSVFNSTITAPGTGTTFTSAIDYHANEVSGTVTGTLTRHWGFLAEAFTKGTAGFPFGAGKVSAITGTPPTGYAMWGVETGATSDVDRLVFKNANGQTTRLQQHCTTGTGMALSAAASSYFPISGGVAANLTETVVDAPAPGALKFYSMNCGVSAAPGAAKSYTFTFRDDVADVTGSSCAISGASATSCTARVETGTAVASASMLAIKSAPASTPTAADGTCTVCWVIDAF